MPYICCRFWDLVFAFSVPWRLIAYVICGWFDMSLGDYIADWLSDWLGISMAVWLADWFAIWLPT